MPSLLSASTVSPSEIAVVVQGPVFGPPSRSEVEGITARGLRSIRRHLPGAEIVLSTWEGTDVSGLEFDRVVMSRDPGPAMFREDEAIVRPSNVNRMIVSTLAGLRATERPFALKARTDVWMRTARFLDFFGRYPARSTEARIFTERVLVHDHFTRFPGRCPHWNYLFHPSDCFQFGRRGDLLTLWDVPIWDAEASGPLELVPEQYLWVTCLRKFMDVPLVHWSDTSPALRDLASLALANNFVVLTRHQFGIEAQKLAFNLNDWISTFSHTDWLRLYKSCCRGDIQHSGDLAAWFKTLFAKTRAWPPGFKLLGRFCNSISWMFARG